MLRLRKEICLHCTRSCVSNMNTSHGRLATTWIHVNKFEHVQDRVDDAHMNASEYDTILRIRQELPNPLLLPIAGHEISEKATIGQTCIRKSVEFNKKNHG